MQKVKKFINDLRKIDEMIVALDDFSAFNWLCRKLSSHDAALTYKELSDAFYCVLKDISVYCILNSNKVENIIEKDIYFDKEEGEFISPLWDEITVYEQDVSDILTLLKEVQRKFPNIKWLETFLHQADSFLICPISYYLKCLEK